MEMVEVFNTFRQVSKQNYELFAEPKTFFLKDFHSSSCYTLDTNNVTAEWQQIEVRKTRWIKTAELKDI